MKKIISLASIVMVLGCQRIETGHIGLRVGFDKQIKSEEIQPGSFPQTIIGDVLEFQVKDVGIDIDNLTPLAKDNSTMQDFDVTVIYNVNPSSVSELYTSKNRGFHHISANGDTLLMFEYIATAARNAVYIAARKYDALDMSDGRQNLEQEVKQTLIKTLADEHLDNSITINQILIRSITPAAAIVESANELVKAKNELKKKEIEVQTAKQEAERIAALNQNKGAIEYMNAMALVNISEAIKAGSVQSIVVPYNFSGIINTNSK